MTTLNARYNYGLDLTLLSIDEGITGYRDDSLLTVAQNSKEYALPLTILSYQDLYGYTMDEIVAKVGRKSNCTFLHQSVIKRISLTDLCSCSPGPGVRFAIFGNEANRLGLSLFLFLGG
jgi:tRNA(Ile)-lysidine synthase TilS/MesJ